MVVSHKDYRSSFGASTLVAEEAVEFSPDGELWSARRLENVVIEGGGLEQPLFMSFATLGKTTAGEPMLISDQVTTSLQNTVVTYSCSAGTVYANGHSAGQSKVCLGSNFVVKCTDDGSRVMTIRTSSACAIN